MGYDADGRTAAVADAPDDVVQIGGIQRIKSGGRFIEEQDFRVESEGAGNSRALDHAAGEIAGHHVFSALHIDHFEFFADQTVDFFAGMIGIFLQRECDVFADGVGAEERAALKRHAETAHDAAFGFAFCMDDAVAVNPDVAGTDGKEPDDRFEHGAFPAAGSAEQSDNFPAPDLK